MGNMVLAASSSSSHGSSSYLLIGLVVLFGILYFVMIRPQRRRQQQAQQTQRDITPGVRVRTTAGMYATVVAVEDQDVILEVAPGVESRFMRRAIMDVVPDDTGTGFSAEMPEDTSESYDDTSESYDEAEDDAATG
jgi:preprotein translocase subunit YajC